MSGILIDTNVLIYAHDSAEVVKQKQAIQVLDHLVLYDVGRLSAQCLSEFFSVVTVVTKGKEPLLDIMQATQQVEWLARTFLVFDVTPLIILEATRGVARYQLAYWDAQLWATARLNQVPIIFSEDFNHGSLLEGVRFINPFTNDFILEEWA